MFYSPVCCHWANVQSRSGLWQTWSAEWRSCAHNCSSGPDGFIDRLSADALKAGRVFGQTRRTSKHAGSCGLRFICKYWTITHTLPQCPVLLPLCVLKKIPICVSPRAGTNHFQSLMLAARRTCALYSADTRWQTCVEVGHTSSSLKGKIVYLLISNYISSYLSFNNFW